MDFVLDHPEFLEMPPRVRRQMILMTPVGWFAKARALWLGRSPWDVLKERAAIRFIQFGGEDMSDVAWERYCNECPTMEFLNLLMRGPPEDDVESEIEDED